MRQWGGDNLAMSSPKVLFGFHAVGVRLKTAPKSVIEIYYEPTRRDMRMRQFLDRAREAGVRLIEADGLRLAKLAGSHGHQGVAARVEALAQVHSLDELLEKLEAEGTVPLLPWFTVLTALIFHRNFADQTQMIMFLKNLAMTGGLLLIVRDGARYLSVDAVRAKNGASVR